MCNELARRLLDQCLRGETWPRELLHSLLDEPCSQEFFSVVVEGLADRFEPALCDTYARLFSEAVEHAIPGQRAEALLERYQRMRRPRRFDADPDRFPKVFVLSRVTLGADVAVTSIMLDAAKRKFPNAEILFVGHQKNWELFAADLRLAHLPVSYPRHGSFRDRLAGWPQLREQLSVPRSLVIDPDSRLTQLGLLPVCREQDYFFFESRAYGADSSEPLSKLAQRWVAETFDISDAVPYIAPEACIELGDQPTITVSLGVGENPGKRVGDPFEQQLLQLLSETGMQILADNGASREEAERVERAIAGCSCRTGQIRTWHGAFAPFAAAIARSHLYVGYDSAGQHVAAACAVPLISIFRGFVSERTFARWRPSGPGSIEVIRVENEHSGAVTEEVGCALRRLSRPITPRVKLVSTGGALSTAKTLLTPEQYLEIERKAECKSEYFQGEMFAMAGASELHNLVVVNLLAALHPQLRGRPCRVYPSDMRVLVSETGLYTYPDVIVVCGQPQFADKHTDILLNPTFLTEVLSPSTEAYDRGRKFDNYRRIASLMEYMLVAHDRVHVDLYSRQPDGRWVLAEADGLEATIELPAIECRIALRDLYEQTGLGAGTA